MNFRISYLIIISANKLSFFTSVVELLVSIAGIGSVDDPILAHYRVDTKKYSEKQLTGIFETASLLGTVAMYEEKIVVASSYYA
ncbi:MAG TPA: hypothetical protein VNW29_02330 [Candidatus Sulfotelmatobacter sp.]|jgi:predicted DNA-binding protein with PD1-like motif|nr:hypothetical protein [Candidatus Sulfotelmatobacter sp.]